MYMLFCPIILDDRFRPISKAIFKFFRIIFRSVHLLNVAYRLFDIKTRIRYDIDISSTSTYRHITSHNTVQADDNCWVWSVGWYKLQP